MYSPGGITAGMFWLKATVLSCWGGMGHCGMPGKGACCSSVHRSCVWFSSVTPGQGKEHFSKIVCVAEASRQTRVLHQHGHGAVGDGRLVVVGGGDGAAHVLAQPA